VQQQWEQEEARLAKAQSANAQPEAVAGLPETPTHLLFPQPAPCAPSRWVISCCSVQWLQSVVQGQWGWHHLLASLPRLVRFFCPSPRRRRSQWFQLEAWVRLRFAHSPGFSSFTNSSFPYVRAYGLSPHFCVMPLLIISAIYLKLTIPTGASSTPTEQKRRPSLSQADR